MNELLAVRPDGTWEMVECSYEGIKHGLNQATIDFLGAGTAGAYIDDEGMLTGQPLNVPVSLFFGGALYGPVVLSAGQPDDEGNTQPAHPRAVTVLRDLAEQWQRVLADAARKGQRIEVFPDADTIPPPTIVAIESDEDIRRWLEGR